MLYRILSLVFVQSTYSMHGTLRVTIVLPFSQEAELFALEDYLADVIEVRATFEVVTMETVRANDVLLAMHKLLALSAGVPKDAMFARQCRRRAQTSRLRKFVAPSTR